DVGDCQALSLDSIRLAPLLLVPKHELQQPENPDHRGTQGQQPNGADDDRENDKRQTGSSSSAGSTLSSCRICSASAACSLGTHRSTAAISPAVSGITAAIASCRKKTWIPEASRTAFQTSASGSPLAVTNLTNDFEVSSGL